MPADPRRLIELGMVPELAREVARMIQAPNDGPVTQAQYDDHEERIAALEEASGQFIAQD